MASESKWVRKYPDLFAGLDDEQVIAITRAIDNNVLEGWEPDRDNIELLARLERGSLTWDQYTAESMELARRKATRNRTHA